MIVAALTSFNKGGTGKSTLAALAAMVPARKPVCIIDADTPGCGSSAILHVSGPGLAELAWGKAELREVVLEVEVEEAFPTVKGVLGGGDRPRVWVLPRGEVKAPASMLAEIAIKAALLLRSYANVIVDLPAYPDDSFDVVIENVDVVLLVANPDDASIRAVTEREFETSAVVKPVLNKVPNMAWTSRHEKALRKYGELIKVPFDPALPLLFHRPEEALRRMRKDTARAIVDLCKAMTMIQAMRVG